MRLRKPRTVRVYSDPEVVELFAEEPELLAVVDAVAATQPRRAHRGPRPVLLVAAVTAAAAIVAAVLMPWSGHGSDVVGEALAAVGDAPVTHAIVSRNLSDDERVNLLSGRTEPVRVSIETFFDANRERTKVVIRHDGVVVADALAPAAIRAVPGMTDVADRLFSTGYRAALARGAASVVRRGQFAGRKAIWLAVAINGRRELVVVDARTYLPIGFRQSTGDSAVWTVERFESLPRHPGQFSAPSESQAEGGRVSEARTSSLALLHEQLGFRPVFAGQAFAGFRLLRVESETLLRASDRGRGHPRREGASLQYRDVYGTTVTIDQAADPEPAFGFVRDRLTAGLDPIPAGHMLSLSSQGSTWTGQIRSHGVFVRIVSPRRQAVIAAARALRLLP